jgi:hypothetical protein
MNEIDKNEVEKREAEKLVQDHQLRKKINDYYIERYLMSTKLLKWLCIIMMLYFGIQLAFSVFNFFFTI